MTYELILNEYVDSVADVQGELERIEESLEIAKVVIINEGCRASLVRLIISKLRNMDVRVDDQNAFVMKAGE